MSEKTNYGDQHNFYNEIQEIVSGSFDLSNRKISCNYPPVDIIEEKNNFRIKADLPGLDRSDFEITLEENVLTISGEKKQSSIGNKNRYCHLERNYGSFHRSFNLPLNHNPDSIEAYYKDGVLDIIISKNQHTPTNAIIIDSE